MLADPERQIPQIGSAEEVAQDAAQAEERGDLPDARANYETSAKIEIYRENKEEVCMYLTLADEVAEDETHKEFHQKLLSNMDQVMRISDDYYRRTAKKRKSSKRFRTEIRKPQ